MMNEGNGIIPREINFAKIFISPIQQEPSSECRTNRKGGIKDDRYCGLLIKIDNL